MDVKIIDVPSGEVLESISDSQGAWDLKINSPAQYPTEIKVCFSPSDKGLADTELSVVVDFLAGRSHFDNVRLIKDKVGSGDAVALKKALNKLHKKVNRVRMTQDTLRARVDHQYETLESNHISSFVVSAGRLLGLVLVFLGQIYFVRRLVEQKLGESSFGGGGGGGGWGGSMVSNPLGAFASALPTSMTSAKANTTSSTVWGGLGAFGKSSNSNSNYNGYGSGSGGAMTSSSQPSGFGIGQVGNGNMMMMGNSAWGGGGAHTAQQLLQPSASGMAHGGSSGGQGGGMVMGNSSGAHVGGGTHGIPPPLGFRGGFEGIGSGGNSHGPGVALSTPAGNSTWGQQQQQQQQQQQLVYGSAGPAALPARVVGQTGWNSLSSGGLQGRR